VQNPEDPVAQKEHTHEKERELPTFRPAEETQGPVLPPILPVTAPTSYQVFSLEQQPLKGVLPLSAFGSSR
jgi:hypothetical protein